MSRAGEKLYGDWQRWNDERDRTFPARRRELVVDALLLLAVLAIGSSALFGFG